MPYLRPRPARDADWYDYGVEADTLLRRLEIVNETNLVGSSSVTSIVTIGQNAYNALNAKNPATLYVITGA